MEVSVIAVIVEDGDGWPACGVSEAMLSLRSPMHAEYRDERDTNSCTEFTNR